MFFFSNGPQLERQHDATHNKGACLGMQPSCFDAPSTSNLSNGKEPEMQFQGSPPSPNSIFKGVGMLHPFPKDSVERQSHVPRAPSPPRLEQWLITPSPTLAKEPLNETLYLRKSARDILNPQGSPALNFGLRRACDCSACRACRTCLASLKLRLVEVAT